MKTGTLVALTGSLLVGWVGPLLFHAQNTSGQVVPRTYVSNSECATCHAKVANSYAQTGMAHSFYRADKDPITRSLRSEVVYYHDASRTWFSMEQRDGRLYQKRWQRGTNGETINFDSEEVDYVVGSGNHVRTYLHRNTNGTITELPLAWYAENGGSWAMNPGFDNAAPPTRHTLSYGCMFCHNGYPQVPRDLGDSVEYPVYLGDLPEGIDCQRCHGPGSAHVQAVRTAGISLEQIRSTILNPVRLDNERQMEVCMQCHLEVTSFRLPDRILRYDQQPFGYTPDKPLASFLQYFQRDPELRKYADAKFEIASAPYRLRQSKCFLLSDAALTCERCHNPHEPHQTAAAEQHYVTACLDCHRSHLSSLVSEHRHTSQTDCIGCHMPKRRTDDVVHVVMTDHLIQRFAATPSLNLAPKQEVAETAARSYRGEVKPYRFGTFVAADDDLYTSTAQVLHDSNSVDGVMRLAELIAKRHPSLPEFSIDLGDALHRAGKTGEAVNAYRDALRIDPHSLRARRSLGAALAEAGYLDQALIELQVALQDYPDEALLWYDIGSIHSQQGQLSQAIADFTKTTKFDPEFAEAYNNLGIAMLKSGNLSGAETAFLESLRLAPYDKGVLRNIEVLKTLRKRRQLLDKKRE